MCGVKDAHVRLLGQVLPRAIIRVVVDYDKVIDPLLPVVVQEERQPNAFVSNC